MTARQKRCPDCGKYVELARLTDGELARFDRGQRIPEPGYYVLTLGPVATRTAYLLGPGDQPKPDHAVLRPHQCVIDNTPTLRREP